MPSLLHETIVDLFRQRATLAPELMAQTLGVQLPAYTEARVEDASLTQIVPTEYHADLVILLSDGKPVYGIVVEVQLARDPDKAFSWPVYSAALRAKLRCPVSVLVVAPDAAVARWAGTPIIIGAPDVVFAPLVIGPGAVPWIRTEAEARNAPELAVLSALAHSNEEHGLDVVIAVVASASGLDEQRAALYVDLVMASLNEAMTKELEAMVATGKHELQSIFAKKYFAKGEAEGEARGEARGEAAGRAAMLLKLLDMKPDIEVPDATRQRIAECTDIEQLERWFERALSATSIDDVITTT